jgi:hypothetical protein
MKDLKSFKALNEAFKVSLISAREDMQTVLKSSAKKMVEELNAQLGHDGDDSDGKESASQQIEFELRGDAFVIGSDSADVVERENGSATAKQHPFLQSALLRSIPDIEKQIGASLTATLAGET